MVHQFSDITVTASSSYMTIVAPPLFAVCIGIQIKNKIVKHTFVSFRNDRVEPHLSNIKLTIVLRLIISLQQFY